MSSFDHFYRVAVAEQKTEQINFTGTGARKNARGKAAQQHVWPSLQIAMTAAQQFDGNSLFLRRATPLDAGAKVASAIIISRA
jgi:hypothetical protein